jgi:hypothetical protein
MSRKPTREESEYADANDVIDEDFDDSDASVFGHIPGGWPEGWNPELERHYQGFSLPTEVEIDKSTPKEWKDFLRKIEDDLAN